MKPAILGGTFNPIHNGHIALAKEVLEMGYSKVLFIPTFKPVHKESPSETTTQQRIDMVKLAIEDIPGTELSLCEIERGGASYSIDTVREINRKYKISRCGLVIGDDQAAAFHSWKNPEMLAKEAEILVAHREHKDKLKLSFEHQYINNPILQISSTELRDLYANNNFKKIEELIPNNVMEYIKNHGLYQKA